MSQRALQPELMDDPGIDPRDHRDALRGLRRINLLSNAKGPFLRSIRAVCAADEQELSILDVATGSGDLPLALGHALAAEGIQARLHGCDMSATALAVARERADAEGITIDLHQLDVLQDPLPEVDVVTCALFLHHLEEAQVVHLLQRMTAAARRLVVVSDLRRCTTGSILARTVPRLLTRSRVVHTDGVLSVQGAFTIDEAASLCRKAGLADVRISPSFPARMVLAWHPPT